MKKSWVIVLTILPVSAIITTSNNNTEKTMINIKVLADSLASSECLVEAIAELYSDSESEIVKIWEAPNDDQFNAIVNKLREDGHANVQWGIENYDLFDKNLSRLS